MRNRLLALAACALFGFALGTPMALAQSKTTIQFERGNDNAAARGTIKGNQYADYILGAKKGQTLAVAISVDKTNGSGTIYFNILPPGSKGEAIFIGSTEGNNFEATLPAKGTYTIRVYQMGAAESSKAKTPFKLEVGISG